MSEELTEEIVEETAVEPEEVVEETNEFIEAGKAAWGEVDAEGQEEVIPPTESAEDVETAPAELPQEIQLPDVVNFLAEDNPVDLENSLEVDALNYWAGGQRAGWTLEDRKEWSEEQTTAFKKYQSAHDKKNAPVPVEKVESTQEFTKEELAQATEDLYKLFEGDKETIDRYKGLAKEETPEVEQSTPVTIDKGLMAEVGRAFEENDTEAFMEKLGAVIADNEKRIRSEIAKSKQSTINDFDQKTQSQKVENRVKEVVAKAKKYEEQYGSDFSRYIKPIATMMDFGDTFSGTPPQDMTLEKAWALCRKYDGGNQSLVNVPSAVAVAPPGSGSGVEPGITDKDYEGSFIELAKKAYPQK